MIWSFQDKDYNNNNREKVEHQTELPAAPLIVSIETFSKGEWCGWHSALKSLSHKTQTTRRCTKLSMLMIQVVLEILLNSIVCFLQFW